MSKQKKMEDTHFEEARNWEEDRVEKLERSNRRAWRVAMAGTLIGLMGVGAVAALAPFKTVVPFVLRVDNNTGIVDVAHGLIEGKEETYDEAVDKYFIAKYIRFREAYLPETRKHDRHAIGLMSSSKVRQEYADFTDHRKNPKAPIALYGDTAEVDVQIKNISPIRTNVAQVRYTKTVKRAGQESRPSHWVAVIAFKYSNANMKPEDRLISPLGFQATQYRNDPETVQ